MTLPLDWLDAFLDTHREELVAFRRHLHMHPERSGEEFETTQRVEERLLVAGLESRVMATGTGLICDIGSGAGPIVALRADLDALAMDDEKNVPYRSTRSGLAHACGHDVHTTAVLGAGLALAHHADALCGGRVRLLFEPAEETVPGGAPELIAAGALQDVSAIFGVHCDPKIDTGQIGVRVGALTSAADMVTIRLSGPGGHTARPQLTVDLVALAGRVATELPAFVANAAPELLLVFGAIHAGDAANVIPAHAELRGSVRTPDRVVWERAQAIVRDAARSLILDERAAIEVAYQRGIPPVVNDANATELIASAAAEVVGLSGVVDTPRSAGGDTFSWYGEHVPAAYVRLGVHDPASDQPRGDIHVSTFDVDERSITIGTELLVRTAIRAIEHYG